MNEPTDQQLLRDYANSHSDAAFSELTRRHLDLVYSAALRMVRDPHLAEDVTQGVFVALAQNAPQLISHPVLSGWLHRTAQNLASKVIRTDVRRRAREQEAFAMNESLANEPDASWEEIAPHLDAAINGLSEEDRDVVLLRFFECKSTRELARIFSITDDTARKRLSRAMERLRELFARRGVAVGASGLALILSANAVHAAPAGLGITVTTATALAGKSVAATATTTISKTITMTILQKVVITAAVVTIAAGTGTYAVYHHHPQSIIQKTGSTGPHTPGSYIANAEFRPVGYATPEAAMETINWGMFRGTFDDANKGLPADEAARMGGGEAARKNFESRQAKMAPLFLGFQIMAKKVLADDQVELKIKMDFDEAGMKKSGFHAPPKLMLQPLGKVGDEWKLNASTREYTPVWETGGQIETYVKE